MQNTEQYVNSDNLFSAGWTRYQINKYLGSPDRITRSGWADVYWWEKDRAAAVERKAPRQKKPPVEVDLLLATFSVNRAAKRYRDAAQRCYQVGKTRVSYDFRRRCSTPGVFTLARINKQKKQRLYDLKDAGMIEAYANNRIHYEGQHGSLAVYRGEGYVFHSTLVPIGAPVVDLAGSSGFMLVEAKEKSGSEARLIDAEFTLDKLSRVVTGFRRVVVPRVAVERVVSRSEDDDDDDEYSHYDYDLDDEDAQREYEESFLH
jgi:hypothetical protein